MDRDQRVQSLVPVALPANGRESRVVSIGLHRLPLRQPPSFEKIADLLGGSKGLRVETKLPSMMFHALHPAIWLVTALPPGTDEMSKHSAPGGDGAALPGFLVRNHTRSGR